MNTERLAKVLVTDFDGTMTRHDFYTLVSQRLLPAGTPDYFAEYRAGRLTHFEALQRYFAAIRADEATVLQLADDMEIDPRVQAAVARLREAQWEIVIASAGCRWYIDHLLHKHGVNIEVHANPGTFVPGHGLVMELPEPGPYFSQSHGIHKAAVVQHYLDLGMTVAFAGDGFPDEPAARLVPAERRYARRDLAQVLANSGEGYEPFTEWSDITMHLLASEAIP